MLHGVHLAVAVGVLEAIQVPFKGPVVLGDQGCGCSPIGLQPAERIGLLERPAHDLEALLEHRPIGLHEHGHGALRGSLQELGCLGF